eukprot:4992778-Pyramimonas_sp.AAC.1
MAGLAITAIVFYAHPPVGFAGEKTRRFAKLGALIQSVQLQWFIAGEFNLDISAFQLILLESNPRTHQKKLALNSCASGAPVVHITILQLLMRVVCLPYIRSASAKTDAPWCPQCGLEIHLRGVGQQLTTRSLEVALPFPQ